MRDEVGRGTFTAATATPEGRFLLAPMTRAAMAPGAYLTSFALEPAAAEVDPTPTPTPTPPSADRRPPVLELSARMRRGRLAITHAVDETARLRLTLKRRAGRRWHAVGRPLELTVAPGSSRTVLRGAALRRFGAKHDGRFRIAVVAVDTAGNAASPVRARFRLS